MHALAGAWVVALLCVVAPLPASGQAVRASQTAVARDQVRAGIDATRRGDWEGARRAFALAYEISPQPSILFDMAGVLVQAGRLVEGAEAYRRVRLDAASGPAGLAAAANESLRQLESRIPRVRIAVAGLATDDRLVLDGHPIPPGAAGVPMPLDPGAHRVGVVRAGTVVAQTGFTALESQPLEVALRVAPPAPARSVARRAPGARAVHPAPARTSPSVIRSPWFWAVTGGVLVAAGAVAVGIALNADGAGAFMGNFPPGDAVVP